ncbi:hypothetical protein LXL04_006240 [Taraxacum kok-saghyz]
MVLPDLNGYASVNEGNGMSLDEKVFPLSNKFIREINRSRSYAPRSIRNRYPPIPPSPLMYSSNLSSTKIRCSESDAHLPSHTIHQFLQSPYDHQKEANMGSKTITMIRNLALDRDDYMIKVRIIRLWKLTKFSNPNHVYEIDMILIDEEGGKIQCNVEAAFIPRLGKLLEEYATNVDDKHRLYFYYTTKVAKCTDFIVSVHCFSFSPFHDLIGNTMPKDTTFGMCYISLSIITYVGSLIIGSLLVALTPKLPVPSFFQHKALQPLVRSPTHCLTHRESCCTTMMEDINGCHCHYTLEERTCKC